MNTIVRLFKKSLALLLLLALLLGTVGCGAKDTSPEGSESSSAQDSENSSAQESQPQEESQLKPEDDPAYVYSLYTQTVEYGADHLDYSEYAIYRANIYDDQGKLIRSAQYRYTPRHGEAPQYNYLESLTFYDENEVAVQCLVFNLYREVKKTETYEYNDAGLLTQKKIVTALGNETYYDYEYNEAGLLIKEERSNLFNGVNTVFYSKTMEYDEFGQPLKISVKDKHLQNSYFDTEYEDGRPVKSVVFKDEKRKNRDYTITYEYDGEQLLRVEYRSATEYDIYDLPVVWYEFYPMNGQFPFQLDNSYYKRHIVKDINYIKDEEGKVSRIEFIAQNSYTNEDFVIAYREYLENLPLTRKDFYLYQILTIDEINELKIKEPYEIEEEESQIEEVEIEKPEAVNMEITLENYQDYFEITPLTVCYTFSDFNNTELFYPYGLVLALNDDYAQSYLLNADYYIPEHSASFVGYELEEISYLMKQQTIIFEPYGSIECTLELTIDDPDAQKLFGWSSKTVTCKIGSHDFAKFLLDQQGVIEEAWRGAYPSILAEIFSCGLLRSAVDNSSFGPQENGDASLIATYIHVEVIEISGTLPVYLQTDNE